MPWDLGNAVSDLCNGNGESCNGDFGTARGNCEGKIRVCGGAGHDCDIVTSECMGDNLDLLADFENEKIAVYTRKM